MRASVVTGLAAAIALIAAGTTGASAESVKISISCGAVGQELQLCKAGAEAWAKKTGNEVGVVSTPNSSTERLSLYQQILAAGSGDIDVFQIDVIWPGILGHDFIDLSKSIPKEQIDQNFKALIENDTVGGKLVAMPWFTDAGVLYYRKDLLEKYGKKPPETWADLSATAKEIEDKERAAGNAKMWGFVYQAKAYEGLTCNALEWVHSWGGGTIVDSKGKITIDNPKAAAALTWAASTVGTIAPEGVLNYTEEESRGVFQSGNAVFMRNWPYAWKLSQDPGSPVQGKVGVVALPKGGDDGQHTATLGGWQLAVSKYSKHQQEAADLVKYLTSAEEQKRRAIAGSYNPTILALYDDPDVLKAVPFFGTLKSVFIDAVARPSTVTGSKYNQVSSEFFNRVHAVLGGQQKAEPALESLTRTLDRLSRGGRW
jgi:trehalose/maltose transport system substrate-binding protein